MKSRKPKTIPVAPGIVMHFDGRDLYIIVNGEKVAKRGRKGTPEAKTWISLNPGFHDESREGGWAWSYSASGTVQ